jgi:alkylhydroperoxidase family enzyme
VRLAPFLFILCAASRSTKRTQRTAQVVTQLPRMIPLGWHCHVEDHEDWLDFLGLFEGRLAVLWKNSLDVRANRAPKNSASDMWWPPSCSFREPLLCWAKTLVVNGRLPKKESMKMDTFLPPIEKPKGLMMKLAYYFTRRQFGKVLTPLRVHSARLPLAFGLFYTKIGKLDKKLLLPPETVLLIREQVARINVCLFCMDIGRSFTIKASMNEAKFDALEQYRTNPLFTDAERAALDYVTELTKDKKVNPDTFARMSRYYSERQICEIVWLVASEHLYNMTNIGLNIHSDMLCDISRMKR